MMGIIFQWGEDGEPEEMHGSVTVEGCAIPPVGTRMIVQEKGKGPTSFHVRTGVPDWQLRYGTMVVFVPCVRI